MIFPIITNHNASIGGVLFHHVNQVYRHTVINFDTSNYIRSSFNDNIVLRCTRYVTHTRAGTQSWKVCVVCILLWCGMVTHDDMCIRQNVPVLLNCVMYRGVNVSHYSTIQGILRILDYLVEWHYSRLE